MSLFFYARSSSLMTRSTMSFHEAKIHFYFNRCKWPRNGNACTLVCYRWLSRLILGWMASVALRRIPTSRTCSISWGFFIYCYVFRVAHIYHTKVSTAINAMWMWMRMRMWMGLNNGNGNNTHTHTHKRRIHYARWRICSNVSFSTSPRSRRTVHCER